VHLDVFMITIYHDARSPERQVLIPSTFAEKYYAQQQLDMAACTSVQLLQSDAWLLQNLRAVCFLLCHKSIPYLCLEITSIK